MVCFFSAYFGVVVGHLVDVLESLLARIGQVEEDPHPRHQPRRQIAGVESAADRVVAVAGRRRRPVGGDVHRRRRLRCAVEGPEKSERSEGGAISATTGSSGSRTRLFYEAASATPMNAAPEVVDRGTEQAPPRFILWTTLNSGPSCSSTHSDMFLSLYGRSSAGVVVVFFSCVSS